MRFTFQNRLTFMMAEVVARPRSILIIIATVAVFTACTNPTSTPPQSPHFNPEWAMDKVWEDGQAEVAHYDAKMVVYGKVRQFDYVYITVKEEFNTEFNVKTDDYERNDLFSVLKVNKFARFETENYPYHYLTSLFFKRNELQQLHKMTHTAQEWCGNTFKQFTLSGSGYSYDYNSYFDGSGDGEMHIPETDLIWEDQLSTLLRSLKFEEGLTFSHRVLESQVNTRTRKPTIYDAEFSVISNDDSWEVQVKLNGERTNIYNFQKVYPNILLNQTSWNGFTLALTNTSRYQYWR